MLGCGLIWIKPTLEITMNDNISGSDGGDDGSLAWDIFKFVAFVIGAVVLLVWALNILGSLLSAMLPLIVIGVIAFLGYKMFIEDDTGGQVTQQSDPALLEHDAEPSTDDILAEDELEKKFEDLEQR